MALEIQKGKSRWWYGRVVANGKTVFKNLGVKIEGVCPSTLKELGDPVFERSRAKAQAALEKLQDGLKKQSSAEELVQAVHEIRTGRRITSIPLDEIYTRWESYPRHRKPNERYCAQVKRQIERFVEFIKTANPAVREMSGVQSQDVKSFLAASDRLKDGLGGGVHFLDRILAEWDATCRITQRRAPARGGPAGPVGLRGCLRHIGSHERYKHGVLSRNETYRVKYLLAAGSPPYPLLATETPPKPKARKTKIDVGVNHGQVADKIVNNNYGEKKAEPIILPGAVASDPDRYNYLEYLMKRLAKFRQAGASYGQKRSGKIHVGVIRKQVENEWGALPKDLKLEKWEPLVRQLKAKIENTALGRNRTSQGRGCYSSFEGFLAKGDTEE